MYRFMKYTTLCSVPPVEDMPTPHISLLACGAIIHSSVLGVPGVDSESASTGYAKQTAPCTTATIIASKEDCERAATALNLGGVTDAGSEWRDGCLFHGANVYYSPHGGTQNPTDAVICKCTGQHEVLAPSGINNKRTKPSQLSIVSERSPHS